MIPAFTVPLRRVAVIATLAAICLGHAGLAHAAPPDPNTVGSDTISGIHINGVTATTAIAAPGADVTITANWSDSHPSYCPGCIDYLAVGFAGQTQAGCLEIAGQTGQSGSGSVDLGPAPTVPGTYAIVAHYEFVVYCGQFWNAGDSANYTVIAQIVVPGPGRAAYCAGAGDTNPFTGARIAAGTFLNLSVGQPLTDSHYAGAGWAAYGQGYGLTCDNLVGLGYRDTGTKVDGTGTHTGTSNDVYEYFVKT